MVGWKWLQVWRVDGWYLVHSKFELGSRFSALEGETRRYFWNLKYLSLKLNVPLVWFILNPLTCLNVWDKTAFIANQVNFLCSNQGLDIHAPLCSKKLLKLFQQSIYPIQNKHIKIVQHSEAFRNNLCSNAYSLTDSSCLWLQFSYSTLNTLKLSILTSCSIEYQDHQVCFELSWVITGLKSMITN